MNQQPKSQRPAPFAAGDTVDQSYRIVRALGSGGHAHVYEAYDIKLDRTVALKVIPQRSRSGRDLTGRALTEARVLVRIQHPNVVAAHSVGTTPEGHTYVVMEMLQGLSLREILKTFRRLSVPEALELAIQASAGLEAAHEQNVIHRDIKPENLVVIANNQVKILDFGVAKVKGYAAHKTTDRLVVHGTALYMSPEQLQGHPVTVRTDVFSLGVVLYEALYSHPTLLNPAIQQPQQVAWVQITEMPPRLHDLDRSIPRYISRFVQRALLKNPTERYASMGAMREAAREVRRRYIAENGEATYRRQIRVLAPQLGRSEPRQSLVQPTDFGSSSSDLAAPGSFTAQPPSSAPLGPGYATPSSASESVIGAGLVLAHGSRSGSEPSPAMPLSSQGKTDVLPIVDLAAEPTSRNRQSPGPASGHALERTLRLADELEDVPASGMAAAASLDAPTHRFSRVELATTEPGVVGRAVDDSASGSVSAQSQLTLDRGSEPPGHSMHSGHSAQARHSAQAAHPMPIAVNIPTERLSPSSVPPHPSGHDPDAVTRTGSVVASSETRSSAPGSEIQIPGQMRAVDRSRLAASYSTKLSAASQRPAEGLLGSNPWKALGLAGLACGLTFGVGFEVTQRLTQSHAAARALVPNSSPSSEPLAAPLGTVLHANQSAGAEQARQVMDGPQSPPSLQPAASPEAVASPSASGSAAARDLPPRPKSDSTTPSNKGPNHE